MFHHSRRSNERGVTMYTHAHNYQPSPAEIVRWTARTCAALLFVVWLGSVLSELHLNGPPTTAHILSQAIPLAVVFLGYAVGWRREILGGFLVVLGTIGFFAATRLVVDWWPPVESAWFALPGVLYLLAAWFRDQRQECN
jgi:hypothetical protein